HRQRVLVLGTDVDEVNVQPVDARYEIRKGVQARLTLAPVVVGAPIPRKLLQHRQPHALGVVADRLAIRPPGRVYAPAQPSELGLRKTGLKRADGVFGRHLRLLTSGLRWARHALPWPHAHRRSRRASAGCSPSPPLGDIAAKQRGTGGPPLEPG